MATKIANHKKNWTSEQEEFLLESYGIAGIQYIMDRLGKTENAIKLKMTELTGSCDVYITAGMLTANEVADALGIAHRTLIDWIETRGFPASQKYKLRKDERKRRYSIDPEKVWKWVAKNKERINFLHIQRGVLNPEPDWLDEELKKARLNPVKRPKNWTPEEDESAWFMWQSGMNYREIAKKLNRPPAGTQSRLTEIRKRKGLAHKKTSKSLSARVV